MKKKYYQGLPVTTSSFILPLAYAFRYVIFELSYLYGALMLITGVLFIVDFKVPKYSQRLSGFRGISYCRVDSNRGDK